MAHFFYVALVFVAYFVLFHYFTIKCCTISFLKYIIVALTHIALLMLHYLDVALFTVVQFNIVLY